MNARFLPVCLLSFHKLVEQQYSVYNRSLTPQLLENGLQIIRHHEDLTKEDAAYVDRYFADNIYPVLTPMHTIS